MANPAIEIVKGGSLVGGKTTTRVRCYHVTGCNPAGDFLAEAMGAQNVPRFGDVDRYISNLLCTEVEPKPMDDSGRTQALVYATFTNITLGAVGTTVDIQTCEYQLLTKYDADGQIIKIAYTDPAGKRYVDFGRVPIFDGEIQLTFTRPETGNYPRTSDYLKHLNAGPFQGKNPGTWRCARLDSESQGGVRYMRRYVFRWRERGWASEPCIFKNQLNGQYPTDVDVTATADSGNGWARVPVYGYADFQRLNLPDVSALI